MNIRSVLAVLAICGNFAATSHLYAAETESRPAHREVAIPKTTKEAWQMLRRDGEVLRQYLEKKELTPLELYEVHMLTYSLRASVQRLRSDWEQVAQEVEELHEVSEANNSELTRKHGQALLDRVRSLQNSSKVK